MILTTVNCAQSLDAWELQRDLRSQEVTIVQDSNQGVVQLCSRSVKDSYLFLHFGALTRRTGESQRGLRAGECGRSTLLADDSTL